MHTSLRWIMTMAGLSLLAACASIPTERGKDDFYIADAKVCRGDHGFVIHAVLEPDIFTKGPALEHMVPIMARIAESGANALAVDLCGFNQNGDELSPGAAETVSAYAERAKDQRMALLVRVVNEDGSPEYRRAAVDAAARALAHEAKAVYWIAGPDAAELALRFKKAAPNLLLAAPANADLRVVSSPDEAGESALCLLEGALPRNVWSDVNWVLPGSPETYALIDQAHVSETEQKDWTPDNSILSPEEQAEGFVALFNGKDLDNWWSFNHGEDSFLVNKEGCIEWHQEGAGGIMTRNRYADFILRLEYNITDVDGNSGVYLRAPRAARQSKIGFEFQINGDSHLTAPGPVSTGAIYDVLPALTAAAKPEGEWNEVEIMLQGAHYRATLNGVLIQDVNFDEVEELRYRLRRGFIGLQDHENHVRFRNVRIKEL